MALWVRHRWAEAVISRYGSVSFLLAVAGGASSRGEEAQTRVGGEMCSVEPEAMGMGDSSAAAACDHIPAWKEKR